jgi:hypothetical protein
MGCCSTACTTQVSNNSNSSSTRTQLQTTQISRDITCTNKLSINNRNPVHNNHLITMTTVLITPHRRIMGDSGQKV